MEFVFTLLDKTIAAGSRARCKSDRCEIDVSVVAAVRISDRDGVNLADRGLVGRRYLV